MNKKQKTEQNSYFNKDWELKYFFIAFLNIANCLICNKMMSENKKCKLEYDYNSKHSSYKLILGQDRIDKFNLLKNKFDMEKTKLNDITNILLETMHNEKSVLLASYKISYLIAKNYKYFSDGEFVKSCLLAVSETICPKYKDKFENIALSAKTILTRTLDISNNLKLQLKDLCKHFVLYSICLDETVDNNHFAQVAIFIRSVDVNFNILEELLDLITLNITTKGKDFIKILKTVLVNFELDLTKLISVTTDGAASLTGKNNAMLALFKNYLKLNKIDKELLTFHCMLHQENLCVKNIDFDDIMHLVMSTVNRIKKSSLQNRLFKQFLIELESEYGDILFYTEIRWLSKSKCLKRFLIF